MSHSDCIFCLYLDVGAPLAPAVEAILPAISSGGFEERSLGAGTRFVLYAENETALERVEQTLKRALDVAGMSEGARLTREVRRDAWRDLWTRYLGEQELTPTLKIVTVVATAAAPRPTETRTGDTLRLLERGAFGFGEHPTTRLVARRLEQLCAGRSVLDVGTGTGVLCILAALRGARSAYGIDTEPSSVEVARANAALNGVERMCRFDGSPIERISERFELVVANIEAPILLELCLAIAGSVAARGQLLLSGILAERGPELRSAYEAQGFTVVDSEIEAEWLLLELRRNPV